MTIQRYLDELPDTPVGGLVRELYENGFRPFMATTRDPYNIFVTPARPLAPQELNQNLREGDVVEMLVSKLAVSGQEYLDVSWVKLDPWLNTIEVISGTSETFRDVIRVDYF